MRLRSAAEGPQENGSERLPEAVAPAVTRALSSGNRPIVTRRVPARDTCVGRLRRALGTHQVISWGHCPVSLEETDTSLLSPQTRGDSSRPPRAPRVPEQVPERPALLPSRQSQLLHRPLLVPPHRSAILRSHMFLLLRRLQILRSPRRAGTREETGTGRARRGPGAGGSPVRGGGLCRAADTHRVV